MNASQMKGLVWDDLGPHELDQATKALYGRLEAEFAAVGVALTVCEDYGQFFSQFLTGQFDFVMIDLFDANGKEVGLKYAEQVREAARDPHGSVRDPRLPIFLISGGINEAKVLDIARLRLVPVSKDWPSGLVIHTVRATLHSQGRWMSGNRVFIIAREAPQDLLGTLHLDGNLETLKAIAERAGMEAFGFELGADLGSDTLSKINAAILESRRIIALLTADEAISSAQADITHAARPNVYLELGLVGAQAHTLEKTLLLCGKNVFFPSDFGGRLPRRFDKSVLEIEDVILRFLREPRTSGP